MKSLSLDSPESTEHALHRKHQVTHHMPQYNQSPQSPVHSRRFLFGKQNRMCSVDLPDTNEKSSASPSPCPSPKPQRLLPTNIFVVLYNFRSRHHDELDLKAGYSVTVVDTSDPDWWQGKCLGKKGYFPSNYVTKLFPGEKPLQIVIQVVEEVDGIIMIRTGINDKIVPCPIKYLQEI
ncbi:unnamed protein product [Oppiella nova]|uniref:SH3 domain-containing protein n=1 Tax=Oppiella nova TaxID=334625 RepID=A0A7R9M6L8_9ACAR|nr:unnamed protein product [Oppiella nova]CAG2171735.1 unnamed protein product [Oppiella nova]